MSAIGTGAAAAAKIVAGDILATVEIAAPPERVFKALTSAEIASWWVNPGVFETHEWSGDARVGGRWRASGVMLSAGTPWSLEGEFLVVEPPRKLVHTWHRGGAPEAPSTVTYDLERISSGTRLTLRHTGIQSPEIGKGTAAGWEASLRALAEKLAGRGG